MSGQIQQGLGPMHQSSIITLLDESERAVKVNIYADLHGSSVK